MQFIKLPNHWCPHMERHLQGFIVEDVLDPKLLSTIKSYVNHLYDHGDTKTFGKHNTVISFDNRKIKLAQSTFNLREIFLLYDVTSNIEYFYQTADSVRDYTLSKIGEIVHPAIYQAVRHISSLDVFDGDSKNYVPFRAHINWTPYSQMLGLHTDADPSLFGTKEHSDARCFTSTVYLNSVDKGGQFWTTTGFVYNPKPNSAIVVNGTKILHGINENKDSNKTNRMAFSVRFCHKDDLYLPGSPEKRLYSVSDHVM